MRTPKEPTNSIKGLQLGRDPRQNRVRRRNRFLVSLFCALTTIAVSAQTFTTLVTFDISDGRNPFAPLIQGHDGNLYGTTIGGGINGAGTIFKITTDGILTTLYNFCAQANCTDGEAPYNGLVQTTDGSLYGTTSLGGAYNGGTVFKISLTGSLTTLYSFCAQTNCSDGYSPFGMLVRAADGNFYGTTQGGGENQGPICQPYLQGCGTIFKITPQGIFTTLYSFCAQTNCIDGVLPMAGLVQASDGSLFGTTYAGGMNGYGALFKITRKGAFVSLHSFNGLDGGYPVASMIQGTDQSLYGTTEIGGVYGVGTVFKFTGIGAPVTLYSFCALLNCADGYNPDSALIEGNDGNFYGTTTSSGTAVEPGYGTVFAVNPQGALTTLYSFDCTDGSDAFSGLLQDTDGTFYGTTARGGFDASGTIFSLSVGLGPFVETIPTFGRAGTPVMILGSSLAGTTGVSFNGTAASFRVSSNSEILARVPAGATTGTVQVTTPNGTLTSNTFFRIK